MSKIFHVEQPAQDSLNNGAPVRNIDIAAWRRDYNEQRPHSSLNYLTPAEFAVNQRQHSIDFLEYQANE